MDPRLRPARVLLAPLVVAALLLAACGGGADGVDIDVADGGQDIEIVADGNSVAVDQGDDAKVPDSWPAGIPTPDAALTMATAGEFDGQPGWTLAYTEAGEADLDAYLQALRDAGGESTSSVTQNGLRSESFSFGETTVIVQLMDGTGLSVIAANAG